MKAVSGRPWRSLCFSAIDDCKMQKLSGGLGSICIFSSSKFDVCNPNRLVRLVKQIERLNRNVYGFLLALGSNPHAAVGGVRIRAERKIFVGVCSLALQSRSPTWQAGWGCGIPHLGTTDFAIFILQFAIVSA